VREQLAKKHVDVFLPNGVRSPLTQEGDHLFIRCLIELLVPQTDCLKRLGHRRANHVVRDLFQTPTGFDGANRRRNDDAGGIELADSDSRRLHCGARRQAVVDENYGPAA